MWVARNGARVGAAAFVLGLSLAGPGVAVASADGTDADAATVSDATNQTPATSSATRPHRSGAAPAQTPSPQTQTAPAQTTPAQTTPAQGPQGDAPATRAARSAPVATADRPASRTASKPAQARRATRGAATAGVTTTNNGPAVDLAPQLPAANAPAAGADAVQTATTTVPNIAAAASTPQPVIAKPVAALSITGAAATASATDPISALFGPIQAFVDGIGLLIRRTFFNQAPTVAPVQLTGQTDGPITGTVGAVDPEGDPIVYSITGTPLHGSVDLGADGSYTYTPGTDFTGRDSFTVSATDTGFHINLLDLFRPASTEAYLQVAQNATQSMLTFTFIYGSGSQYWSQAARAALQDSADKLAGYFVVTSPVNVTFDVTAEYSPLSGTLAQSGSDLTSSDPGFYDTVVQQKILTGVDANGAAADGTIDWNFGQGWGYGSTVPRGQYDFTSTAMHEMLHAFGFLSNVDEPGWDATNQTWTTFDSYMVTADRTQVIPNTYRWNSSYNTNLTGGNGGLYFGGPNAVAVYGGPVPLYTPDPWEPGSSVSHLDDDTFVGRNSQLMNAISDSGTGVRVVSPIELAILQDIGYTVNSSASAFLIVGFGLIRRRRRKDS